MATFVKLRDEPGWHDEDQWIDAEKVDSFVIFPDPVPAFREARARNGLTEVWFVQFRSAGRILGAATIFGRDRAERYALKVIRGQDMIV